MYPTNAEFLERCEAELETEPKAKGIYYKNSPFWRLRIGNYRTICKIDKKNNWIVVRFIGHRREVYDEFSKGF